MPRNHVHEISSPWDFLRRCKAYKIIDAKVQAVAQQRCKLQQDVGQVPSSGEMRCAIIHTADQHGVQNSVYTPIVIYLVEQEARSATGVHSPYDAGVDNRMDQRCHHCPSIEITPLVPQSIQVRVAQSNLLTDISVEDARADDWNGAQTVKGYSQFVLKERSPGVCSLIGVETHQEGLHSVPPEGEQDHLGHPSIVPVAMHQHQPLQVLELRDCEVTSHRCLATLSAIDAHSDLGLLYHRHIICSVTNCQRHRSPGWCARQSRDLDVVSHQCDHLCLLQRRYPTSNDYLAIGGHTKERRPLQPWTDLLENATFKQQGQVALLVSPPCLVVISNPLQVMLRLHRHDVH
mmetsp:Transcript_16967/g.39554  ORF Transcript_16967/g.39554 Transcript_16967/m.39554 type:complete len:347 (+) Transcript_16967:1338-2378(+)